MANPPPTGLPTNEPTIYQASPYTNPAYFLFSNGGMLMYGVAPSTTMSTATGGLFTSSATIDVTFPVPFAAAPSVTASVVSSTPSGCGLTAVSATAMSLKPTATVTGATGNIHWQAGGTWF